MARVTVEDCVKNIPNRFELVLVASNRSKKLSRGVVPNVDRDNDKNPILALREIAQSDSLAQDFRSQLINTLQKVHIEPSVEDIEEHDLDMEKDWSEQIAQLSRELESLGSVEEDIQNHMQIEGEDAAIDLDLDNDKDAFDLKHDE